MAAKKPYTVILGDDIVNNLLAEMRRYGIRCKDIENLLGCTEKTVRNKIDGTTDFSLPEAQKIRDVFFPGLRLEYLFADDNQKVG